MKRKVLLPLLACAISVGLFTGCVGFNRTAYNVQKTSVDLIKGSVHGYNLWLASVTNDPAMNPVTLSNVLVQRDKVYSDVRKSAKVELAVQQLRLSYRTNSAGTNKAALQAALLTLGDQGTNIFNLVRVMMNLQYAP